jgi:hypothetical protein
LRKIFRPYWNPLSQSALPEAQSGGLGSDPEFAEHRTHWRCRQLSNSCFLKRFFGNLTFLGDISSLQLLQAVELPVYTGKHPFRRNS